MHILTSPFIPLIRVLLSIPGSGLYTTRTIPFHVPGLAGLGAENKSMFNFNK